MPVHLRVFREQDLSGVLATVNSAVRADRETKFMTESELRARLTDPTLDPARDLLVVEDDTVGIVGFGSGALRREPNACLYMIRGHVHPGFRGQGIGTVILTSQLRRAEELKAEQPQIPLLVAARALETQKGAVSLLVRADFRPMRYFYEMEHNLEPGSPVSLPAGINLTRWSAWRNDRAVWSAVNEAFADHWGYIPETFDAFQNRLASGVLNPEFSLLLYDKAEIAGGALCQMGASARERFQKNMGYLGMLFVRPAWRKRGLGGSLLRAAVEEARNAGHSHLRLNVDAENTSGAVRLYEKNGFRQASVSVLYQKRIG